MRRIASVLIVAGIVLVGGAGVALAAEVATEDFVFDPKTITVDPGEDILFDNTGNAPHTATADNGSFDTGNLDPGQSETITINAEGTYPYYCRYHGSPGGTGMAGTIVVGRGGGGGAGTTPPTATPLPVIAALGAALLAAGILLGRRRARTS
jgi:plastocyanin